jgi:competence protein ComGC
VAGDVNKSVNIAFKASTEDLERSLKKIPNITDAQASKAAKELDKNFKKMEGSADRTSKSVSAKMKNMGKSFAAVGAAMVVMGAAAIKLGQHFANLTNELVDASAKTGIAVDTLAGLRLAAEGSGLAFSNLEGGLIKFQGSMDAANKGSKLTADAFGDLGVKVADAEGNLRNADDVFNESITALGKMENLTERNATAMILFGRSAGGSLIQSGALENLENMKILATEFGISIDQGAINSMARFQRKMAEFGTVASGEMQRLMNSISGGDSLNSSIDFATQSIVYFGSIAGDALALAGQQAENLFGAMRIGAILLSGVGTPAERIKQSINLTKELIVESAIAKSNYDNMFTRANESVEKFQAASAASTAPKKMTDTADATEDATDAMKGLSTASKQVSNEIDKIAEFLHDLFQTNIKLEKQIKDRLTPEYRKQMESARALGLEIESVVRSTEDQFDALLETASARALSVKEQVQLNLLAEELNNTETLAAQNRIAEQKELYEILNETKKKYLDDIFERKAAEEQAQADIISAQQDGITRVSDLGMNFVNVMTAAADLMSVIHEKQITEFRAKTDSELAAIDKMVQDGVITAEQAAARKASIEKGYNQQVEELKLKEFKINQSAAIASIAFDTAKAIAQALALPPVVRGATIAAVVATGALQTAAVLSQSPPKFDVGGMVGSSDSAPDIVQASLLSGEAVLDRSTVQSLGGAEGVRRLQSGGMMGSAPILIQPFKHIDRYNRALARQTPRRIGSGAY